MDPGLKIAGVTGQGVIEPFRNDRRGVIASLVVPYGVAIPSFLLYLICFFSFLRLRKARSPRSALALLAMTGKLTLTLTSPRKGEEKSSGMRTSSSLV